MSLSKQALHIIIFIFSGIFLTVVSSFLIVTSEVSDFDITKYENDCFQGVALETVFGQLDIKNRGWPLTNIKQPNSIDIPECEVATIFDYKSMIGNVIIYSTLSFSTFHIFSKFRGGEHV